MSSYEHLWAVSLAAGAGVVALGRVALGVIFRRFIHRGMAGYIDAFQSFGMDEALCVLRTPTTSEAQHVEAELTPVLRKLGFQSFGFRLIHTESGVDLQVVLRRPSDVSLSQFEGLMDSAIRAAGDLDSVGRISALAHLEPEETRSLARTLGSIAGPGREAWTQEWPAHLASIEQSWKRPFQVAYYTAGFACAAVKWRIESLLRGPATAVGRFVDWNLTSDARCGLTAVCAVSTATRLTEDHSGTGAAVVVLITTTAASLTAVNQARQMRGVKRKRRKTNRPG